MANAAQPGDRGPVAGGGGELRIRGGIASWGSGATKPAGNGSASGSAPRRRSVGHSGHQPRQHDGGRTEAARHFPRLLLLAGTLSQPTLATLGRGAEGN